MSIVKVAAHCGVSKSTVSLVINNSPLVMPSTAEKVRQAMEEIGYVPSPREQRRGRKPNSMRPNRSLNIALVTLGIPAAVLRAPLYADVLHGVATAIREQRHHLSISNAPKAKEFICDDIFRSGADGFLLFGRGESSDTVNALRDFPCVSMMGVDAPRTWCDWVGYDDAIAGKLAATYVLERGHKNCAYFGYSSWQRGQVFSETIRAAGGHVATWECEGLTMARDDVHQVDQVAIDKLVDSLVATSPRPTAIFVWADMLTAALYPRLYARGLQPGRDITIVSCNNEWPLLIGLRPRPAVVDVQGIKIGQRAVQQLLWRMQNRRESRVAVMLAPTLIPEEKLG